MMGFVFRLTPPRPNFQRDMSDEERATMTEHVAYWSELAKQRRVLAFGPVSDPRGDYGIGIVVAASMSDAEALRDDDPAFKSSLGFNTEVAAMPLLLTPDALYAAEPD